MKESKKPKIKQQPEGQMLSMLDRTIEKVVATQDLTMSERPLHNYVAEVSEQTGVRVGVPLPMGTHARGEGVNFSFFSRHASRVRLELFDHPEDAIAARVIDLDPARNRTGDVWHVWIEGVRPGQLYAYRVDGPFQPGDGHPSNFNKLLIDPFATAISRLPAWEFGPARGYDDGESEYSKVDNAGAMPKCVFTHEYFHWHGDYLPRHPWSKTIIFETHVRGFTICPNSGIAHPGTYRGLLEKIPYFKELGVTAVDEQRALFLMFNTGVDGIDFNLPLLPTGTHWYLAADTAREAPQDLFDAGKEPLWENPETYLLGSRSSAILLVR